MMTETGPLRSQNQDLGLAPKGSGTKGGNSLQGHKSPV